MTARLALVLALTATSPALAQPGGPRSLAPETIIRVQDALLFLGFELTLLERETIPLLKDPGFRNHLRQKVTALQAAASELERALQLGGKGFLIQKRYLQLDHTLHDLHDAIETSPGRTLALSQSAKRLNFVDTQLGGLLAIHGGGGGEGEIFPVVLRRTAHALEEASDNLFQLAQVSLPADPVGLRIKDNCRKFRSAAGSFADRLELNEDLPEVRKRYNMVNRSWQRVAWDINALPDAKAHRLILAAQQVDQLHGRLSTMLKIDDGGDFLIRDGDEPIRNFLSIMQGSWSMQSYHNNGNLASGPDPNNKVVFSGNRMFRVEGGATSSFLFRVVEIQPKVVKIEMFSESDPRRPTPILLQVEGNILRYAHFLDNRGFPPTFLPRPGDNMLTIVWRRDG